MYTPTHFRFDDAAAPLAFMRQYSFATLVTAPAGEAPFATHLPFTVEERPAGIFLLAHLARANPQWHHFADGEALVIFQEPHAYISPRWYDKELSVPTWNYTAVHAYGPVRLIEREDAVFEILEKLIGQSEPAYFEHWNRLPPDYKSAMAKGIAAFEIAVQRLEGKEKLSQNRAEKEVDQIMGGLENSPLPSDRALADLMRRKYKR